MSTSIYKPLGLSFLSRTPDKMLFCRPEVQKVKRVLFGPPDHLATQKFVEEELEKIAVTSSERWNFDFVREKPLSPNGVYNWRPATPQKTIRPIKRRPSLEFDCQQELYGEPREIVKPIPVKAIPEDEVVSAPKKVAKVHQENLKPQRLITDFMSVKKRTSSEFSKLTDWAPSMERPSKLPRLSEFSS